MSTVLAPSPTLRSGTSFGVAAVMAALVVGVLVPTAPQVAFILVLVLLGVAALAAPSQAWIGAALVATVSFKGLSDVGLLPSVATFADLFLGWGALAAAGLRACMRSGRSDPRSRRLLVLLASLTVCAAASAAFAHTEVARPAVFLLLLGLPFAVVAALLLEPPSARAWRVLSRLLVAAAIIQIPFAAWQFAHNTNPDNVQGTLVGAGAGAHVMSAIAMLGAIWLVAGERRRTSRLVLAGMLLVLPFMADAKQVIFAAPVMLLAGSWRGARDVLLRGGVVVAAVTVLVIYIPAGGTAEQFLQRSAEGQGGKQETVSLVVNKLGDDPARLVFGLGPAESVSRAAFMTTPLLLHADSPLHVLGLSPAVLPSAAQSSAVQGSGGGTSFNSGVSSALGVLGDLGLAGVAIYGALIALLWKLLRRQDTARATAGVCALALFGLLGLVFDWWEQPPFTIMVSLLIGLALTDPRCRDESRPTRLPPDPRIRPVVGGRER